MFFIKIKNLLLYTKNILYTYLTMKNNDINY